jgi:hypothetical protein
MTTHLEKGPVILEPRRSFSISELADWWRYRELLFFLTWATSRSGTSKPCWVQLGNSPAGADHGGLQPDLSVISQNSLLMESLTPYSPWLRCCLGNYFPGQ